MEEKRRPGLLGYFTLALMTATIVVCVLTMVVLREKSSLALVLGTVPALAVIDLLGRRLELSMGDHLPKRIWDGLVRLALWLAAVLVLWFKQAHGGLTADFVMLLLVIVQALTLLIRVIHAMGGMKDAAPEPEARAEEPAPEPEEEKPEEPADKK